MNDTKEFELTTSALESRLAALECGRTQGDVAASVAQEMEYLRAKEVKLNSISLSLEQRLVELETHPTNQAIDQLDLRLAAVEGTGRSIEPIDLERCNPAEAMEMLNAREHNLKQRTWVLQRRLEDLEKHSVQTVPQQALDELRFREQTLESKTISVLRRLEYLEAKPARQAEIEDMQTEQKVTEAEQLAAKIEQRLSILASGKRPVVETLEEKTCKAVVPVAERDILSQESQVSVEEHAEFLDTLSKLDVRAKTIIQRCGTLESRMEALEKCGDLESRLQGMESLWESMFQDKIRADPGCFGENVRQLEEKLAKAEAVLRQTKAQLAKAQVTLPEHAARAIQPSVEIFHEDGKPHGIVTQKTATMVAQQDGEVQVQRERAQAEAACVQLREAHAMQISQHMTEISQLRGAHEAQVSQHMIEISQLRGAHEAQVSQHVTEISQLRGELDRVLSTQVQDRAIDFAAPAPAGDAYVATVSAQTKADEYQVETFDMAAHMELEKSATAANQRVQELELELANMRALHEAQVDTLVEDNDVLRAKMTGGEEAAWRITAQARIETLMAENDALKADLSAGAEALDYARKAHSENDEQLQKLREEMAFQQQLHSQELNLKEQAQLQQVGTDHGDLQEKLLVAQREAADHAEKVRYQELTAQGVKEELTKNLQVAQQEAADHAEKMRHKELTAQGVKEELSKSLQVAQQQAADHAESAKLHEFTVQRLQEEMAKHVKAAEQQANDHAEQLRQHELTAKGFREDAEIAQAAHLQAVEQAKQHQVSTHQATDKLEECRALLLQAQQEKSAAEVKHNHATLLIADFETKLGQEREAYQALLLKSMEEDKRQAEVNQQQIAELVAQQEDWKAEVTVAQDRAVNAEGNLMQANEAMQSMREDVASLRKECEELRQKVRVADDAQQVHSLSQWQQAADVIGANFDAGLEKLDEKVTADKQQIVALEEENIRLKQQVERQQAEQVQANASRNSPFFGRPTVLPAAAVRVQAPPTEVPSGAGSIAAPLMGTALSPRPRAENIYIGTPQHTVGQDPLSAANVFLGSVSAGGTAPRSVSRGRVVYHHAPVTADVYHHAPVTQSGALSAPLSLPLPRPIMPVVAAPTLASPSAPLLVSDISGSMRSTPGVSPGISPGISPLASHPSRGGSFGRAITPTSSAGPARYASAGITKYAAVPPSVPQAAGMLVGRSAATGPRSFTPLGRRP